MSEPLHCPGCAFHYDIRTMEGPPGHDTCPGIAGLTADDVLALKAACDALEQSRYFHERSAYPIARAHRATILAILERAGRAK